MLRAKTRYFIAALAAALTMSAMPAVAWELGLTGTYNWEYELRSQSGPNGFFGAYDADMGSGTQVQGYYAPYNAWLGWAPRANIVSGSDASWQTIYMDLYPELRINSAVRVRGRYHVGEFNQDAGNDLVASEYLNYRHPGTQRAFSPGYWNLLWLSAQLPWGEMAFGKRPSAFGTGLGWNGTESRTSESLNLTTFYGPLRISMSCYPSRRAGTGSEYYNRDYDKNNGRLWDIVIPSITYRNGPIDTGVILNIVSSHRGGEGILAPPTGATGRTTNNTYQDQDDYYGGAYLKYSNGIFFFNTEVDFDSITQRNRRKETAPGGGLRPRPGTRDTYVEHWRAMAEATILAGPAKMSLLYAWSQGDDRRGGQFDGTRQNINAVTYIDRRGVLNSNSFSNTGLFRPYSYLMVYTYGTGMFVNADTNNGYVEDASVWAGRLDYAVAANLHVFGSFMYAERQSKSGFAWGCLAPNASASNGTVSRRFGTTDERVGAPNIPDTALGWEADAGFQWRLLEGFSANLTFGYWQPGDWFKWACVDKGVFGWGLAPGTGGLGNTLPAAWGVNPNRAIDPIWGLELVVKGEF